METDAEWDITFQEYNVIHAMQTSEALEDLKTKLQSGSFRELESGHSWIYTFKAAGFVGYKEAVEHLKRLDAKYMQLYNIHYDLWFIDKTNLVRLLDWKEEMIDRAIAKYGLKRGYTAIASGDPKVKKRWNSYD